MTEVAHPTAAPATVPAANRLKVWDLTVRLGHWSAVGAFAVLWLGEPGVLSHRLAGYGMMAVFGWRIVWGFIGRGHARFSDFVRPPSVVIAYLRAILANHPRRFIGHNPAGGAMVLALLGLTIATGATGWLSTTDAFFGEDWLASLHELLANLMLLGVSLHLLGVLAASLSHKENLVKAMITGRKRPVE